MDVGLTLIFDIGSSTAENLQWPDEVKGIHVVVKSEEYADRLCLSALFTNCTHFDGIVIDFGGLRMERMVVVSKKE